MADEMVQRKAAVTAARMEICSAVHLEKHSESSRAA